MILGTTFVLAGQSQRAKRGEITLVKVGKSFCKRVNEVSIDGGIEFSVLVNRMGGSRFTSQLAAKDILEALSVLLSTVISLHRHR